MHFGIIAAGEGSRLAAEGAGACKPLIPLRGEPMLGRLMTLMASAGAEGIAIIVNAAMPQVADYVESMAPGLGVPVEMVVKSTPSSMHSFYEISRMLRGRGRFIATTVDTVFSPSAFRAYADAWRQAPADVDGMMGVTTLIDDEKPLYVEMAADGAPVTAFLDTPLPGTRYVSAGVYGLDGGAIDVLDRCMETGVSRMRNFQRALLQAGLRLRGRDLGPVLDVDHVPDIAKAEALLDLG